MLENRPVLQKTLIGMGAFSFVFTAAMAGSAFMISGGFGLGGDGGSRSPDRTYAAVSEASWGDWVAPAYASTAAAYEYAQAQAEPEPARAEPALYAEPLEGGSDRQGDGYAPRSEAELMRMIAREFAASERMVARAPDDEYYAESEEEYVEDEPYYDDVGPVFADEPVYADDGFAPEKPPAEADYY
jgi:hypothetical protein